MIKTRGYGCSSIINALCLQFELAGHGLKTGIKRSMGGQWVVEAKIDRPEQTSVKRSWRDKRA